MTVYVTTRIYGSDTDASQAGTADATYATAREAVNATITNSTTTKVGQLFLAGPVYQVHQIFPIFDTSGIPAAVNTGTFSFMVGGVSFVTGDVLELRAVSSTANLIAGSALAAQTPLFGSWTVLSGLNSRRDIPLTGLTAMARSASCPMLLHGQKQRLGTAPTGTESPTVNLANASGTTNDPYLEYMPAPWTLVGVGALPTPGTTLTLTEPAGVADGDLLVACIASRSTATTAPTITGWTAVGSQNNNNTLTTGSAIASGAMLYQIRSGTPTLAVTIPSGISVAMGRIVAYRGAASTTPLDASTAVTMAAGTAVSVTGLTTTQDDDLIVAMAAGGQEAAWSSFTNVTTPLTASGATTTTGAPSPTAWTERADNVTTTGADTSLGIFDAVRTTTGATGNLTVTASVSAGHVVIAGAFKIASAGTPVTVSVTGQAVTTAVGEVTVSIPAPVSITVDAIGQAVTTAVGDPSVTGKSSFIATGQAVTSAVGPLALIVTHARFTVAAPEMIASTQGVGVEAGGSISTTASGSEITSGVGQVSVKADHRFSVTGQQVTASVGEVSVTGKANVSTLVAGQATTAAVGQVTVDARSSVSTTATGQSVTSSVGEVSVSTVVRIDVTVNVVAPRGSARPDESLVALLGDPTVTGKANVSTIPTGQAISTAVGTPTITGQIGISMLLAGQELVSAVGTPTVTTHARFTVTGQAVTSAVGQVGVSSGTGVTIVVGGSASPTLPAYRSHTFSSYVYRPFGLTLDKPAGTVENDVMLAAIVHVKSPSALNDIVAPAGWTKIGTSTVVAASGASAKLEVWWKRAGGSEPASYFFDVWADSDNQYSIISYSGCPTSGSPIDAFSTNSANTGATATGTSVTTTQANDNLIWIGHNWNATGTLTPPSGMTERADSLLYISEQDITAAGATGNRTQTLASSNPWAVYLLSLKGAPGAAAFPGLSAAAGTPAAVTGQANLILTGQEVTASGRGVGVTAGGSVSTTVSSGLATTAAGQVGVKADHRFSVTAPMGGGRPDESLVAFVGQVTVDARQTVSTTVIGQSLAVALSPVTVTAGVRTSVSLAGQSVTSAVGTVNFSLAISALVPVVSEEMSAEVGAIYFPTGLDDSVTLDGQAVQAEVGAVTVTTVALRGMDVWTGTAWAGKPAKVWTGSAWVPKPVKLWNGSSWV